MESRSDSLAAELKRQGLFDDYFAYWLQERPSFADRLEWLEKKGVGTSMGSLHRLHQSAESAEWRKAEAVRARAAMDAALPENMDVLIRDSLLTQRFNATLGELSHQQLMDHLKVENSSAELALKEKQLALRQGELEIKQRRIAMLEEEKEQAAAELQKLREPSNADNPETRQAILDEVDRIMGLKK